MRVFVSLVSALVLVGCASFIHDDSRMSDAPAARTGERASVRQFGSYADALAAWAGPEDVNAWIGATFEYDFERAFQLSESQRVSRPGPKIIEPAEFFGRPTGVCVDLARFAVETLKVVAPELKPRYLMIEFDPARLQGQVLRRHWVVAYETADGTRIVADSKRPGVIVGPYQTIEAFLEEYAIYRGRDIVSYRETDSYSRRLKLRAKRERGGE